MQFRDVNQQATITRIESEELVFKFEYSNDFYGSCIFTARLFQHDREPLSLDEDSLQVGQYKLKNGSPMALLRIAKTFFKRTLNDLRTFEDLEYPKPKGRPVSAKVFSYLLLFILLALAAGVSVSIFQAYPGNPDFYEQWLGPVNGIWFE